MQPIHGRLQFAVLFLLFTLICDASAHSLSVSPVLPTNEDAVTIIVTGHWAECCGPAITGWLRSGTSIRIDAFGVVPGIPSPVIPYKFQVDIDKLPPGRYRVDYYLDFLAGPAPPPASPQPDAFLEFDVLTAPAPIPVLTPGTFILFSVLLLLPAIFTLRKRTRRPVV